MSICQKIIHDFLNDVDFSLVSQHDVAQTNEENFQLYCDESDCNLFLKLHLNAALVL